MIIVLIFFMICMFKFTIHYSKFNSLSSGVYLASETYAEMTLKEEEQRKEIQELLLKKRAMEEERDRMEGVFEELNQKLEVREQELASTVGQLNTTKAELDTTSKVSWL